MSELFPTHPTTVGRTPVLNRPSTHSSLDNFYCERAHLLLSLSVFHDDGV